MSKNLEDISGKLLQQPFNLDLRKQYANMLFNEARFSDSLLQWELLLQSDNSNREYLDSINLIKQQIREQSILQQEAIIEEEEENNKKASSLTLISNAPGFKNTQNTIRLSSHEKTRFIDIAGMTELKKVIRRRIIDPFVKPSLFEKFKRKAGGGVLLYGPPGCGKTMIARAIATECKASFQSVGISDILNMFIGESESNLSSIFDRARQSKPSVLFFDELDALAYSRSKASSDNARTLVNEFLTQLDGVSGDNDRILILSATNMPWDVDDAMKRPGRFSRQIFVPPPDSHALAEMLKIKLCDIPCDELDTVKIASLCQQFSGADMDGLIELAKDNVLDDIMDNGQERNINENDLLNAIELMIPSTLDWLKTSRNLVKYGNAGGMYRDVEKYLKSIKMY